MLKKIFGHETKEVIGGKMGSFMICISNQTTCYKGDQIKEDEVDGSGERVGETRNACRILVGGNWSKDNG